MTTPEHCYYCAQPAVRSDGGQRLCAMHYRFRQMRGEAKRRGKLVPTWEQLGSMVRDTCPDCGERMHWLAVDGYRTVATLQHYRDGTMAIVCKSCNSRHHTMPGDTYRAMPKDHKWCGKCEQTKPRSDFSPKGSYCRPCAAAYNAQLWNADPDHYNSKQRERRARLKAESEART